MHANVQVILLGVLALMSTVSAFKKADEPKRYIVSLTPMHTQRMSPASRVRSVISQIFNNNGKMRANSVTHTYDFGMGGFSGFAAYLTHEQLEALSQIQDVDFVEEDGRSEIFYNPRVTNFMRQDPENEFLEEEDFDMDIEPEFTAFRNPPRPAARRRTRRIQDPNVRPTTKPRKPRAPKRQPGTDGVSTQEVNMDLYGLDALDGEIDGVYHYPSHGAEGVDAYVIDTGVDVKHPEFEGRAIASESFVSSDPFTTDGNGHGTHVAGTIGGKTYGVAKKVSIIGVKVLGTDGSGMNSDIIAGMNYVIKRAASSNRRSVANMSLGGRGRSLNAAADSLVKAGIALAVAAGNSFTDACYFTPAGVESAITVGAVGADYSMTSFSNYGSCVDIFAPGFHILSAKPHDKHELLSGTSMATPHVVGVLALAYAENDFAKPADAYSLVIEAATKGRLSGTFKSPNIFLQLT